jgi:hypothetical protein|tara:strand:+ start:2407 stop:3099 length:693 start_codon:yes stop_codon:yes gene_type:complete
MGSHGRSHHVVRWVASVAILTVAAACGGATEVAPPLTTVDQGQVVASSTTVVPAVPTTTVPVSTTTVPVPTTTVPVSTTTLAGGPIPDAATGFCASLAVVSGELVVEVESVVAVDGTLDARSHHALLLATRNLLAWTSNRVPPAMSSDLRLLTGVYADLGVQLDRLDPETVTMPRIQALVFSYIFDSADVKAADLDLSARRLSAFVTGSCGSGYPLMESLADLFAEVPED